MDIPVMDQVNFRHSSRVWGGNGTNLNHLWFQGQFIQLCKSMYDMFTGHESEQDLYHAIATVGTLLLRLGEVGKQFYASSIDSATPDTPDRIFAKVLDNASDKASDNMPKSDTAADKTVTDKTVIDTATNKPLKGEDKVSEASLEKETETLSKASDKVTDTDSKEQPDKNCVQADDNVKDKVAGGMVDQEGDKGKVAKADESGEPSDKGQSLPDRNSKSQSQMETKDTDKTREKGICRSISSRSSISESARIDTDWSITFEQFIASVLTEPPLVDFFEKQVNIVPIIERFRNRRVLERVDSFAGPPTPN